jgi:hypothetical protein
MWGNKKSHTPQAVDPEPKNWQNKAAAKARSGVVGGNNQDLQGCDGVSGSDSGPRDSVAWIEPACERRNLGQRGPVH